ncbi:MAG: hypothetical protein IK089_06840 [Oxalobacter sp.]|nr:hypothetical protein [Oxalobacter sp.]
MFTLITNSPACLHFLAWRKRIANSLEEHPATLLVALFFFFLPDMAFAANGMEQFLCSVASNFKAIVGVCALVAIVFWAIEHVFGVSKIHDMVIKVGIACAVIAGAATLIKASGLTTCSSW